MSNVIKDDLVYPDLNNYNDALAHHHERNKLEMFNWYLRKYTHLFSHVFVEIHPHRELMKSNADFKDNLIYVRLKASPEFCRKMRCNQAYPRGQICTAKDTTVRIFKSGDSDVTACENACRIFEHVKTPVTGWSKRCEVCMQHNQAIYSQGIDDYNRVSKHTTPHFDTIGTGYDVDNENYIDANGNETMHFKLNKYYCNDFDLTQIDAQNCGHSTGEKVASFFIGTSIYELGKYFINETIHGESIYTVKNPNVSEISKSTKKQVKDDEINWNTVNTSFAFYINPNVKLGDLGFDFSTNMHMFWTTEHDDFGGGLKEPLIFYRNVPAAHHDGVHVKIPRQFRIDKTTGRRTIDEFEYLNITPVILNYNDVATHSSPLATTTSAKVLHVVHEVVQVTFNIATAIVVQKCAVYILKNIVPVVMKAIGARIGKTLNRVLLLRIIGMTVKNIVSRVVTQSISKLLFGLLASFCKNLWRGVSIALIVAFVVDLVLGYVDVLDKKYLGNQSVIDDLSELSLNFNQQFGSYKMSEFSPIAFIILDENEQNIALMYDQKRRSESEKTFQANASDKENAEIYKQFLNENAEKMLKNHDPSSGGGGGSTTPQRHMYYKKLKVPKNANLSISPDAIVKYDNTTSTAINIAEYLMKLKLNSTGQKITMHETKKFHVDLDSLHAEIQETNDKLLPSLMQHFQRNVARGYVLNDIEYSKKYNRANTLQKGLMIFSINIPIIIAIGLLKIYNSPITTSYMYMLVVLSVILILYMSLLNDSEYMPVE
uniref:P74-like protein n=1 Tax=Drosophila-associated filamentous virus TaxID=2743186 RepID=A0A6M9U068_9VIRU|nr:P74-like protein [Drosophila-associated filamentous virus]